MCLLCCCTSPSYGGESDTMFPFFSDKISFSFWGSRLSSKRSMQKEINFIWFQAVGVRLSRAGGLLPFIFIQDFWKHNSKMFPLTLTPLLIPFCPLLNSQERAELSANYNANLRPRLRQRTKLCSELFLKLHYTIENHISEFSWQARHVSAQAK